MATSLPPPQNFPMPSSPSSAVPPWWRGEWVLRVILVVYVVLPGLINGLLDQMLMVDSEARRQILPLVMNLVWMGLVAYGIQQTPHNHRLSVLKGIGLWWPHGPKGLVLTTGLVFLVMALWAGAMAFLFPHEPNFSAPLPSEFYTLSFVQGAIAIFLAPLGEELAFRGVLQGYFSHHWSHAPWVAIVVTTLVFLLCHSQYQGVPMAMGYVMVMSLWLCFFRAKTQSLYPGLLAHSLNNALVYFA